MNNKKNNLLLAFTCAALISSCGMPDKQYLDNWSVSNFGWDASNEYTDRNTRLFGKFDRMVLEYDEKGNLFDQEQKHRITKYLENNKNVFIVVYIHGWHHNSSIDDENYKAFDNILIRHVNQLERLGKNDSHKNTPHNKDQYNVLGIYVGWRGEISSSPFNYFTLPKTAKIADAVGGNSLSTDLQEIANKMREKSKESKMLATGHSLGGRILTKAFISNRKNLSEGQCINLQPLGANTLITTINAAVGASDYDNIFLPKCNENNKYPTWINFTSKDDWATDFLYPLFIDAYGDNNPSNEKAIGHYSQYQTHELKIEHLGEYIKGASKNEDGCLSNSQSRTDDPTNWYKEKKLFYIKYKHNTNGGINYNEVDCYKVLLEPLNSIPRDGRLWNIYTDKNVIDIEDEFDISSQHNGYVQTNIISMLDELLFNGLIQ